jgi:hypothetical protein
MTMLAHSFESSKQGQSAPPIRPDGERALLVDITLPFVIQDHLDCVWLG